MNKQTSTIVKQAVACFKQGDFSQAKRLYQQAADQYGPRLFANNIRLCELRIGQPAANQPLIEATAKSAVTNNSAEDLSRQLAETQTLLEHYYTKCQQMEYQLMDRKQ